MRGSHTRCVEGGRRTCVGSPGSCLQQNLLFSLSLSSASLSPRCPQLKAEVKTQPPWGHPCPGGSLRYHGNALLTLPPPAHQSCRTRRAGGLQHTGAESRASWAAGGPGCWQLRPLPSWAPWSHASSERRPSCVWTFSREMCSCRAGPLGLETAVGRCERLSQGPTWRLQEGSDLPDEFLYKRPKNSLSCSAWESFAAGRLRAEGQIASMGGSPRP